MIIYDCFGNALQGASSVKDYTGTTPSDMVLSNYEGFPLDSFLKVATWNIGHFSGGGSPNTSITAANYAEKKLAFNSYISGISPSVFGVNEYSETFAVVNGENKSARTDLFSDYPSYFIGNQRRYSCNAMFSKTALTNPTAHEYECLQNETITHTTAIQATDYYYLSALIDFQNEPITIVSTHLAFDLNRPSVLQSAQIAELIDVYENTDRIVIMGDLNNAHSAPTDLFKEAGYSLANDGQFITGGNAAIDNIVVKGLKISGATMYQTDLSDHNAISCYLTLA